MQLILDDFKKRMLVSSSYVQGAHRTKRDGKYLRSKAERQALTEYAFLKAFVAWEYFLERSMLRYSLGDLSCNGRVAARRLSPQNEIHAYEIIKGKGSFVEWGQTDTIRGIAKILFVNGEPFETPLTSISRELQETKIVRNSITHITTTTQKKIDDLALQRIGFRTSNITPYQFMMSASSSGLLFSEYILKLDIAADMIANY